MRIVFMGTPDFAVPTLAALVEAKHEVASVYTQPPRPAGRGMVERQSAVHRHAVTAGLPVLTPSSLRQPAEQDVFGAMGADAAVVVAYGLLLPEAVLAATRFGCFNLHASLLPRWRGAAPIQRAIMAGDRETAATVMQMDEGLDTGPVCAVDRVAIGPDMTAGELHDLLAARGARLMMQALADLASGRFACSPQPSGGATYAAKIGKEETRLDFGHSALEVHNRIRALSPVPGAWFEAERNGQRERIRVLRSNVVDVERDIAPPGTIVGVQGGLTVSCGAGAVRLLEVQRSGKRPVTADEFLRGFPLTVGARIERH